MYSCRYSCHILMKLSFSQQIFRKILISNFMKIRPLEAELFCADRQTDMVNLIVPIRNFANAPKTSQLFRHDLRPFKANFHAHIYLQCKFFEITFIQLRMCSRCSSVDRVTRTRPIGQTDRDCIPGEAHIFPISKSVGHSIRLSASCHLCT
jgi:hypothetical protein